MASVEVVWYDNFYSSAGHVPHTSRAFPFVFSFGVRWLFQDLVYAKIFCSIPYNSNVALAFFAGTAFHTRRTVFRSGSLALEYNRDVYDICRGICGRKISSVEAPVFAGIRRRIERIQASSRSLFSSMIRRINSATATPSRLASRSSQRSCGSVKNNDVRFIGYRQAYIGGAVK